MKINFRSYLIAIAGIVLLASCGTLEKASMHGFSSGYYQLQAENKNVQQVYVDVQDEQIDVYPCKARQPDKQQLMTIPLKGVDGLMVNPMVFKKQSLDVDITSILLKYRPSVYNLPSQLTTDLNIALFAGWRHDRFQLRIKTDPLGKRYTKVSNRGYDFGLFAGPGPTLISPFTTRNLRSDEYSGMILQGGIAGFVESNLASFGFALGYDYLLNSDRKIWIYNQKPWVGFVVGVALN